ncbi:MAG: FecR domain-containing protein [bacterium]
MSSTADDCRKVERLTLDAADGVELTHAQTELIASHRADCAPCRSLAAIEELILDDDGLGAAGPQDELSERRLLAGVIEQWETAREAPKRPEKRRPDLRVAAAAAVLTALGAALGIFVYRAADRGTKQPGAAPVTGRLRAAQVQLSTGQVQLDESPASVGQRVRPGQTVSVRKGRSALTLPAHAAVMLENDSAVRVDRLTAKSTALTLQRGSMLATVRPRPGRPHFIVKTRAGRIEVTGTVFWVEHTQRGVVVAVLRGAVRVVEPNQPPRVVRSGQQTLLRGQPSGPGTEAAHRTRALGKTRQTEAWRWVRALQLITAAASTRVKIDSRPTGALVAVDDLLLVETPLQTRLAPGHHRLELRKPGYAPVVRWITVNAGEPLTLDVTLRSMLAGRRATSGPGTTTGSSDPGASRHRTPWSRPHPPWSQDDGDGDNKDQPDGIGAAARPGAPPTTGPAAGTPTGPTAKELVARARKLRARGDYRGAVQVFRELLKRYPKSGRAQMARVSLGLLLLDELKDANGALLHFDRYLASSRFGALAQEASYGRIRALRRLGLRAAEIRRLQQFLTSFPTAVHAKAVRLRLRVLGIAVPKPAADPMGLGGMGGVK